MFAAKAQKELIESQRSKCSPTKRLLPSDFLKMTMSKQTLHFCQLQVLRMLSSRSDIALA
eukprot:UN02312